MQENTTQTWRKHGNGKALKIGKYLPAGVDMQLCNLYQLLVNPYKRR
jgi:hypothetical protein